MTSQRTFIPLLALAGAFLLTHEAAAIPMTWSGNGHGYELFTSEGLTWADAEAAALGLGGHLVSITSAEEDDFVHHLLLANFDGAVWAGGLQDTEQATSASTGWTWTTGETWDYTNWAPGEANDYREVDETFLAINWGGDRWNDEGYRIANVKGYVVEYSHVPDGGATVLLLGLALFGLVAVRRGVR